MKHNRHLYSKYFDKIQSIFLALDEKDGLIYCEKIFSKAQSEDDIILLSNQTINGFEYPISKIGYLREIVNENDVLMHIFNHFVQFIVRYPTRVIAKEFYIDQMTYKAIAKKNGIKINTVKTCVRRFRLEYKDKVLGVANQKNISLENFEWLKR